MIVFPGQIANIRDYFFASIGDMFILFLFTVESANWNVWKLVKSHEIAYCRRVIDIRERH